MSAHGKLPIHPKILRNNRLSILSLVDLFCGISRMKLVASNLPRSRVPYPIWREGAVRFNHTTLRIWPCSSAPSIPEHDWSGRKSEGGPLVLKLLHINITSLGRYVHDKVSLLSSTSGEAKEHEYALSNKKGNCTRIPSLRESDVHLR